MGNKSGKFESARTNEIEALGSAPFNYVSNTELIDFGYGFENLVMEGGGAKIVAFVGALKVFEVTGILKHIVNLAGSSAGAILATALAVGYNVDEILRIIVSLDFNRFKDDSVGVLQDTARLVTRYGWCPGDTFFFWIGDLVRKKTGCCQTTFAELHASTKKTLVVTACNVNTGRTHYFSHYSTPDMQIRHAVRMSMSIPFLFVPILRDSDYFVDGGLFNNYPLSVFDNAVPGDTHSAEKPKERTIGLKFMSDSDRGDRMLYYRNCKIGNIMQYGMAIINGMLEEIERLHINEDYWKRTVQVPSLGYTTLDFGMTSKQKLELFVSGSIAAQSYLGEWIKQHRRRPSLMSYLRHRRKSSSDKDEKRERIRLMRHLGRHNDSIFGPIFTSTHDASNLLGPKSVHRHMDSIAEATQGPPEAKEEAADEETETLVQPQAPPETKMIDGADIL